MNHKQLAALCAWSLALCGTLAAVTASAAMPLPEKVGQAVACACFKGPDLVVDERRAVTDPSCDCPFAERVRGDLSSALKKVPTNADDATLALTLEKDWLPMSPEYERLLRYDAARYRWFLQNVRCTCSGCKATVYFSNCQLSCSPAIVYKRRARVWLAMGLSTDQLIDFYLAEYNRSHSAREQITRSWLLPKRQKSRGWMVPALLIIGAILGLGLALKRLVGRSRPQTTPDATDAPTVSEAERARVLNALDDMEQDGEW